MKLSTVFTATAIVSLLFGLGFVLAPAATLAPYGLTTDEAGIQVARFFGAALLGYAAITWFARNTEESSARRALVLGLFLGFGIGFVVSLVNQLSGLQNALGWSTVAIYLLFALGYGYFQFAKPTRPAEVSPGPTDTASS
ncbi:MAG: hypothetical protein V3U32_08090 [Anaerolineales bacterium]